MSSRIIIPANLILLSQFLPTLTHAPYSIPAERLPSFPQLIRAVGGGRVPATRIGGRWFIAREDIPAIIRYYNLTSSIAVDLPPVATAA
jgi:hypothetical protein